MKHVNRLQYPGPAALPVFVPCHEWSIASINILTFQNWLAVAPRRDAGVAAAGVCVPFTRMANQFLSSVPGQSCPEVESWPRADGDPRTDTVSLPSPSEGGGGVISYSITIGINNNNNIHQKFSRDDPAAAAWVLPSGGGVLVSS